MDMPDPAGGGFFKTEDDKIMRNFLTPQCVPFPYSKKEVLSLACGSNHLLVLARDRDDGSKTLYGSGLNTWGQLGLPKDDKPIEDDTSVKDDTSAKDDTSVRELTELRTDVGLIAAGPYHSYIVDEDGYRMFASGKNAYGQLGLGPSGDPHFGFEQIAFPRPILLTKIAAGGGHGMALDNHNTLYTWGFGAMGATGHLCDVDQKEEGDIFRPTRLDLPSRTKILDFGGGSQFSAVVLSDNDHESE